MQHRYYRCAKEPTNTALAPIDGKGKSPDLWWMEAFFPLRAPHTSGGARKTNVAGNRPKTTL